MTRIKNKYMNLINIKKSFSIINKYFKIKLNSINLTKMY